ncbi:MAG: O-antigen ligase family protein [Verrucomicrobia bacterium]|nr:O-antigen ligase family protein [Verrucomicrobiota bacterium]
MHLPPIVALWLTFGLIFFLFRRQVLEKSEVSPALWLPLIWLLINGSRSPGQWLNLDAGAVITSGEDGSPLDATFYFALIVAGYAVLRRRGVDLLTFARNNRWLTAFLMYSLISILWSDFPLVAFKRWIKILGHPIMVLVILTDPVPLEAVKRLLKRIAYVLVPLSICFIKYFPQYGRGFDSWTGQGFNGGVALNKNELGLLCLIFGIFFFWSILQTLKIKNRRTRRKELILDIGFFVLNWWLLAEASSATSLVTMLLGIAVIWFVGLRFVDKRYVGFYLIAAVLVFAALEPFFGIYTQVVKGLGRNLNLTDRTDIWQSVLKLQDNPIFGRGFESFWLGSRLDTLWVQFPFHPIQAHNGYIETYLNLGWIGIALLVGQFVGTFLKIQRELVRRFEFARLRLAFLLAIIVFNYTEAAFVNTSFVWTMFFLIAVDYPNARQHFSRSVPSQTRRKLVPAGV